VYTAAIMTGPIFVLLIAAAIVTILVFRGFGSDKKGNPTFKVDVPLSEKNSKAPQSSARAHLSPYVETDEGQVRRRVLNEDRRRENRARPSGQIRVRTVPQHRRSSKGFEIPGKFVVLDLETTGLSAQYNEIIEIGAILVDTQATQHLAFQTLVRPSVPIPRNITALTGITQEMVDRDGVELTTALTQFVSFIGELPLVAFNAPFDMSFLEAAAARCGLSIGNPHSCALALARRAWPGLPSYKLSNLAKLGNLPLDNAHRSIGDCERAAVVYLAAASKLSREL
jgi:DNA polymerase-3 subunit epsilon